MRPCLRWLLPIALALLMTPFLSTLDLALSNYFYSDGFSDNRFFLFLYNWGVLPAWLLFFGASLLLILSYASSRWTKWRQHSLLIVLALILGPGFIAHALFKEHWGRPRPKQIEQFGGQQSFRPFYRPNFNPPEPSKSFVCGHCTMGFYFFSLAIVGRHLKNRKLEIGAFLFALALGTLLSLARIAQGGHFLSDALFSALFMWLTVLALEWLIYSPFQEEQEA